MKNASAHKHSRATHDTDTTRTSTSTMGCVTSKSNDTLVNSAAMPRGDFSSLPPHVISTHILRSDFLPEPGDLGRLRAVSHWMRNAVDATGRAIKKLSDVEAMQLGNVSLLKDRHSRGVLRNKSLLCAAAARSGQLEELKALRAKNFPWGKRACAYAAWGGYLEVLKWARENVCPWDKWTCAYAAGGGHLEVLKWARENDCSPDAAWYWARGRARGRGTRADSRLKGYVET